MTNNVTALNDLNGEILCSNFNQKGHNSSDCFIAFCEQRHQKSYTNQQHQQQPQTSISNQLSAPHPKMIKINTNKSLNPPMKIVNEGDQQNVLANYQQFCRNIQEFGSNQANSTSNNAVSILI